MKPESSVHSKEGMNCQVASLSVGHNLHVHDLSLLIFVLDPPVITYTRCFLKDFQKLLSLLTTLPAEFSWVQKRTARRRCHFQPVAVSNWVSLLGILTK